MRILIVGGYSGYETPFIELGEVTFNEALFMAKPEAFDLVVFAGGEDVCPDFYGHTSPKRFCGYNIHRDIAEQRIFEVALKNNVRMTGICRGSQFLNVMAGGTLMHHIGRHGQDHTITTIDGRTMTVTSTHHQMCLPAPHGFVVAWSTERRSNVYYGDKDELVSYDGPEVEGIFYPKERIFAVQFHPEYMRRSSDGFLWYQSKISDFLSMSGASFLKAYGKHAAQMTV